MAKNYRHRLKACTNCDLISETMYRVKTQSLGKWLVVCPACQATLKDQPGYLYGGTWKAVKRH